MFEAPALIERIIVNLPTAETSATLIAPAVGQTTLENELLLFIKPEVFMVEDPEAISRTMNLVFSKLEQFGVKIRGVAIVGGRFLERYEIMGRHYGLINRLSRQASGILSVEDRNAIEQALGIELVDCEVLGGHEYLQEFPGSTPEELDQLWFSGRSTKIRSGFYVRLQQVGERRIVLVNAFHPEQLAHFTNPGHRIVLMLLHSDTDWSLLKSNMVGATYAERADPNSIRGILHLDPSTYGFDSVTVANNAVHLSAGPFEGGFEIVNFFGSIGGFDPAATPPLVIRRLAKDGSTVISALMALENPTSSDPSSSLDLFSATEEMNTSEALRVYWEQFSGRVIS